MRFSLLGVLVVLVASAGCSCGSKPAHSSNGGSGGSAGTGGSSSGGNGGDAGSGGDATAGSGGDSGGGGSGGTGGAGGDTGGSGGDTGGAGGNGLAILSFDPPAGFRGVDIPFTASGRGFVAPATVTFTNIDAPGTSFTGTVSTVAADGTSIEGTIAADPARPQGIYDVTVGSNGATATLQASYTVTAVPPPTVTDVSPPFAWRGDPGDGILSDRAIAIRGTGFVSTPTVVWESVADPSRRYSAAQTSFVDATTINAVVPSETLGMPPGDYHVLVQNPDQQSAHWLVGADLGVFQVKPDPGPSIYNLDPPRNSATATTTVRVMGAHFMPASVVELLDAAGATVVKTPPVTFVSDGEIDAQVSGLALGFFPVRVRNPDGQFDTFFSYQATSSAPGKLGGSTVVAGGLVEPRERHGGVNLFDDFGQGYLFVAGGVTVDGTKRSVSDTFEVAPVSIFGPPGTFGTGLQWDGKTHAPNHMSTPRAGLTLARVGSWIYAIGGTPDDPQSGTTTALPSVERSSVLGVATMPSISTPVRTEVSGLAAGAWYYQVSAICPDGETLPSLEAVNSGPGGTLSFRWGAVSCDDGSLAASYNVYRSLASDGRAGTTRLLAAEVVGTTFTDDARGMLAPAPGKLRGTAIAGGSLTAGLLAYRVSAVLPDHETVAGYPLTVEIKADGNQSVQLRWNPIPGATYRVYRTSPGSPTGTAELLADGVSDTTFIDDGSRTADTSAPAPDGLQPLHPGAMARWQPATSLVHPREGAEAVVVSLPDPVDSSKTDTYVFVVGGRAGATDAAFTADSTVERAQVQDDGSLGAFALEDEQLKTPRAYLAVVTDQGRRDIPLPPQPKSAPCPDQDGDGHASAACGGDDCNDLDPTIHPGAFDICGDMIDQDCSGSDAQCDCSMKPDADGDGHNSIKCGGDDCNDSDPTIYPGATEICGDGIDQDCNGSDLACQCHTDADGDGYIAISCGGDDCNDNDPNIHPGAYDIPDDGIDQNCDGVDARSIGIMSFEPVHLAVAFGSDGTNLLGTFEACTVDPTTGHTQAWAAQTAKANNNQVMGGEALLYTAGTNEDFVWLFGGATSLPASGQMPRVQSASRRYFWYGSAMTPPAQDAWIADFSDPGANLAGPRAFFSTVRLDAFLYHVGGTDGATGPVRSLEWQTQ